MDKESVITVKTDFIKKNGKKGEIKEAERNSQEGETS